MEYRSGTDSVCAFWSINGLKDQTARFDVKGTITDMDGLHPCGVRSSGSVQIVRFLNSLVLSIFMNMGVINCLFYQILL